MTALEDAAPDYASPCPCCGSYAGETLAVAPALLGVCDVLVVRALEVVGKRLVRAERRRFNQIGSRPWHEAHTIWRPDESAIAKTVDGSWDVIPALLSNHGISGVSPRQVQTMLDSYVRDLLITSTPHTIGELRYRFECVLGVSLPEIESYRP